MGLVFDQVSFDGQAPDLNRVADKVTEMCALAVIVERSDPTLVGNFYDQHGHMAFACAPDEQLEIFSYRPGAVRQLYDEFTDGVQLPIERFVTGLNEPANTQTVYLRGFIGLETLMTATVLALEALGGRPRYPITVDIRRQFGTPLTESDLRERRGKLRKQLQRAAWLRLVWLPVILPLFVLGLVRRFVSLPGRIRTAQRIATEAISKRDHDRLVGLIADHIEFVGTTPDEHSALDRDALQRCTRALEAAGFVHAMDYSARFPGHAHLSKRPPGFARLWSHPGHRCFAEMNQVFSTKGKPTRVRCVIGSWLEQGWSLSTTDREFEPLQYVCRRPRRLWSCHPRLSSAELLAEHLRRREQMMVLLGIPVTTELTPEAYFSHVKKNSAERKEVLRSKTIATIRAEREAFERSPIYEWSGELPVTRRLGSFADGEAEQGR